jgi:hypothetical protein
MIPRPEPERARPAPRGPVRNGGFDNGRRSPLVFKIAPFSVNSSTRRVALVKLATTSVVAHDDVVKSLPQIYN